MFTQSDSVVDMLETGVSSKGRHSVLELVPPTYADTGMHKYTHMALWSCLSIPFDSKADTVVLKVLQLPVFIMFTQGLPAICACLHVIKKSVFPSNPSPQPWQLYSITYTRGSGAPAPVIPLP